MYRLYTLYTHASGSTALCTYYHHIRTYCNISKQHNILSVQSLTLLTLPTPGLPEQLSDEEFNTDFQRASEDIQDTRNRVRNPLHSPLQQQSSPAITDGDIAALKRKFPFLQEYSDAFIRHAKPDCLVKLEATNLKMKEAERGRDNDDRLAANRLALSSQPKTVQAGQDDRCSTLHEGRFLAGACCSTTKLWLKARELQGLTGAPPLGNYDMASLGLGGCTTSRGWVDIANPGSARQSIKSFSLNNCGQRVAGSSSKDNKEDKEFTELGEFSTALRTMRTAVSLVHPWNYSVVALENFLLNSKFCNSDIGGLEKQAAILTRFVDYVLSENASKWRDHEPFLTAGELKNTWHAFFSALPQSHLARRNHNNNKPGSSGSNSFKRHQESTTSNKAPAKQWSLPYIDVCYKWNRGFCNKPANSCTTSAGRPLRHVCDERTDPSNLAVFCGQAHKRVDAHP